MATPQAEEVQEHTVAGGQVRVLLAEGGGRQRQADAQGLERGHAGRAAAPAPAGGDGTVRVVRRVLAPEDSLLQLKTAAKGTSIFDVSIRVGNERTLASFHKNDLLNPKVIIN